MSIDSEQTSKINATHLRVRVGNMIHQDREAMSAQNSADEQLARELNSPPNDEWVDIVQEWLNLPTEQRRAKMSELSRAFEVMGSGEGGAYTLVALSLLRNSLEPQETSSSETL